MKHSDLRILIREIVRTVMETPDGIKFRFPDGREQKVNYSGDHVKAVIIVTNVMGKDEYFAYLPKEKRVISSNKEYEKKIAEYVQKKSPYPVAGGDTATHGEVKSVCIQALQTRIRDNGVTREVIWQGLEGFDPNTWNRRHHSRLYELEGRYLISFWEPWTTIKRSEDTLLQCLKDIKVPLDKINFEPSDYDGAVKLPDANTFFGKDVITGTADPEDVARKQQMHVNPQLKKQMLKVPPHQLSKQADKMGMPFAKVKQYWLGAPAE